MTPEIRELGAALEAQGYIADGSIATAAYLAREMKRPLLVEGDAGVGKTELAKVLARLFDTELIRLQCYEGLDVQTALYEWDYPRQLLWLRIAEGRGEGRDGEERPAVRHADPRALESQIYSRNYLLERPLLRAITHSGRPCVLLIDEIDRADDGFEAFLLELLSDFQVTIPELGTLRAEHPPHVVLTSNHTRELGDALRRRCLYLYIEHPSLEKEVKIIRTRCPEVQGPFAEEVARFLGRLRELGLVKPPGVAETLDFTRALLTLRQHALKPDVVAEMLGCLLKDRRDVETVTALGVASLVAPAEEAQP
jgi:MoxR-like ATPase